MCTVTVPRTRSVRGCSHRAALPSAKDRSARPCVHKILPVEKSNAFGGLSLRPVENSISVSKGEEAAALISFFFIPAYSGKKEYTEENLKHFCTDTFTLK